MKLIIYILVLLSVTLGLAQPDTLSEKQLMSISLDSLRSYINFIFDEDIDLTHSYSKTYLKYSKQEKDKEKIADAYLFLTMSAPKDQALDYCDSLIYTTKDFDTHNYPEFAYYMKAETLYGLNRYKEALTAGLASHKKITPKTSKYLRHQIMYFIAIMAGNNNQHELALTYYHQSINYFKKEGSPSYFSTLFGLAESHLALKNLDSAAYYINEGFKDTIEGNFDFYMFFLMTHGRLLYQKGDYLRAKDSLTKSLPMLEEINNLPNLATNAFWLGKVEEKLGNSRSAINYYKVVDSIFTINKTIPFELRPAWTGLINFYDIQGDSESELKYARKLILVDSILNQELGFINNEITHEFVIPSIKQKNQAEKQRLQKSKNKAIIWAVALGTSFGISGILFFLHRKREFKRRKKYELVIEKLKKESEKQESGDKTKKLYLKAELIKLIEEGLKSFEKNEDYLKNDISLGILAKKIGTNQRYLSRYINHIKQMGFPEYLNNLRIEYVLKRLQKSFVERDDRFRIWSMSEVAKAAGFGSREYYSKAFFKYTNMKHVDYVRQLEKNLKKSRNS